MDYFAFESLQALFYRNETENHLGTSLRFGGETSPYPSVSRIIKFSDVISPVNSFGGRM